MNAEEAESLKCEENVSAENTAGADETRLARLQRKIDETTAVIELIQKITNHCLEKMKSCEIIAAKNTRAQTVRCAMAEYRAWSNLLHELDEACRLEKRALRHRERCFDALKAEAGKAGKHVTE